MRIICICFLCFFLTISSYCLNAEETGPADTIHNYFSACQNGDIEAIKNLITRPFYDKRKVLLNNNTGYSKFLIQHFDAVELNVISSSILDVDRLSEIVVERKYPDDSRLKTKFILTKEDNKTWKIYSEGLLSK